MPNPFSLDGQKIMVLGGAGMVGQAIVRCFRADGLIVDPVVRKDVDLTDQRATHEFLRRRKPDIVVLAAAKVGGIHANRSRPAQFLYDNAVIASNVVEGAHRADIDRLLVLGSSCIYPKMAPQPIAEESLLTGPLEPTNEWYALAKIAAIKLCDAYRLEYGRHFISAMPCNLYGTGDNFDLETSHVLPALIRKFSEAVDQSQETVTVWGDGSPLREFLHTDDLARACRVVLENFNEAGPINIGSGTEVTIKDLALSIAGLTGFEGSVLFDENMPNGTPRKVLNSDRLRALGWSPKISLAEGLKRTLEEFRALTPA